RARVGRSFVGQRRGEERWRGPRRLVEVEWAPVEAIRPALLPAVERVLQGTAAERVLDRLLRAHRGWAASERKVAAAVLFGIGLWRGRLRTWAGAEARAAELLAAFLWGLGGLEAAEALRLSGGSPSSIEGPGPSSWEEAWSVPSWLVRHTIPELGEAEAEALWAAQAVPGPIYLRVNRLKTSLPELQASLTSEGVETRTIPFAPSALEVVGPRPNILGLSAHQAGWFEVQDLGSQLLGLLVAPAPTDHVLDLCAGAGGKTLLLASEAGEGARIDAWDIDASRLLRLRTRAERAGAHHVRVLASAPTEPTNDRVLVDGPCSELGTLRRGPDLRWRLTPEVLRLHVPTQRELLESASRCVRPGGRLVYATCTLNRAENQEVALEFERANPNFRRELPVDGKLPTGFIQDGFFLSLPHRHNTDGFFAAVYTRLRCSAPTRSPHLRRTTTG